MKTLYSYLTSLSISSKENAGILFFCQISSAILNKILCGGSIHNIPGQFRLNPDPGFIINRILIIQKHPDPLLLLSGNWREKGGEGGTCY